MTTKNGQKETKNEVEELRSKELRKERRKDAAFKKNLMTGWKTT